ncbi:transposable element gene [Prunus dulcis]|uniref:Transposable element protein n=1 Tax=Prunus dulcis TaxID=3755 RepID=A0A4Y1R5S8_PRUDU|nr:transposable element gene [Prunus dulcis]
MMFGSDLVIGPETRLKLSKWDRHRGDVGILPHDSSRVPRNSGLDMKKNLISLCALESKGLKITMESGVLKAVYGALVVMKGSTVIGGAAITETADADSTDTIRVWVYTMKHKDEVLKIFLKWKKMIETQSGRKIKTLKSDNGGEYKSNPFLKFCQDEGIVRHFTVRGTPQ